MQMPLLLTTVLFKNKTCTSRHQGTEIGMFGAVVNRGVWFIGPLLAKVHRKMWIVLACSV